MLPWSSNLHQVDIAQTNGDSRPNGGHQQIGVSSLISEMIHHEDILTVQPGHDGAGAEEGHDETQC